MKKSSRFINSEIELLIDLLKQRYASYDEYFGVHDSKRYNNTYFKPLISALNKLSNYQDGDYSEREKTICISCVNEHYDTFLGQLQLTTAFSWLTVTDEQRSIIQNLDDCRRILIKCGYLKSKFSSRNFDRDFMYGNVLSAVDKLRKAEKVLLSKVGEKDFYKIGFIYDDKEYVTFELKQGISWRAFQFSPLYESPMTLAKKRFSMITDKNEARTLLSTVDKDQYHPQVLSCMNILLQ